LERFWVNEKFIWKEDDSIYSIDISVWSHETDCSDEDCVEYWKEKYMGTFVNGVNILIRP